LVKNSYIAIHLTSYSLRLLLAGTGGRYNPIQTL